MGQESDPHLKVKLSSFPRYGPIIAKTLSSITFIETAPAVDIPHGKQ